MTEPAPEVQALIDLATANFPPLGTEMTDISAIRAYFAARPKPPVTPPPVAYVQDEDADGVPVRVYDPGVHENAPVILYCHGGGFVLCDLETHDGFCRALARGTGATVVAVDYRRAPEHPFPAAPEDAYTALLWAARTFPGSRVAVAGDSAGGNLATVLTLLARDRGGPRIACQALYYPMLDPTRSRPSHREHGRGRFLTSDHLRWYWDAYLREPVDRTDRRAAPLAGADLSGLPPAHIVTAGFDPLRDDGLAYAEALTAAGVPVAAHHYAGMFHGFLTMAVDGLPEAAEARATAFGFLRTALDRTALDPH
ncbi:alpha/beta hydrolase domain-containing protein [Streptomyces venezuelae]|uniref:alpha/beta hydrolase n=1 Tax=Streptomyces gardneri TaxID=66892 RepID=UPI0006BD283A|nr:alpha/beta hydrolase [Streptomyces gardneri]ALO13273.1 alpha/beta hydrolase domain-containing protein [Streptomyces venezuelae]WRK41499.1 alpha/beta hydrolase [Streptomyces venezuelae]CUM36036.1 Esterase/lipase [Streptomyces venezuelae]